MLKYKKHITPYMKKNTWLILPLILLVATPRLAQAIPPPDFLFNFASQFAQFFSFFFIASTAIFSVLLRQSGFVFSKIREYKKTIFVFTPIILVLSAGGAYFINDYLKTKAELAFQQSFEKEVSTDIKENINKYDTLAEPPQNSVTPTETLDPMQNFILSYYQNLGTGNIQEAYDVSKKNVSYETYLSWYENVTSAEIEQIEKLDENKYSLSVALTENGQTTRYAVIMTIAGQSDSLRIEDSTVRTLSVDTPDTTIEETNSTGNFLSDHPNLSTSITNEEFQSKDKNKVYILDAREDEEYEIGFFTGGTHIRFADLLAGSWVGLPTDKEVIVLCWSGIRGQEVAEFLRGKGIAARYLEEGADGWVNFGGAWNGEILFSKVYSEERYTKTFTTKEVQKLINDGVLLVDARDPDIYVKNQIAGSINIAPMFAPTAELQKLILEVPANSTVVTVCDSYLSCFYAKIIGIKLEKYEHEFLGRYTAPYEY